MRGRRLGGRYLLDSEIESGGMASVWRAHDDVLARTVAVKILHPDLSSDREMFERFSREAVAAASLSHPSVVRVFDTGTDDGICFIVMELVQGTTLAELIEAGPLEPEQAAAIARGILDALVHAHEAGIVHRDVKPGNVLVDPTGAVKVADFGIAKAAFAAEDITLTGKLLGTARYLAPEQVTGGAIDGRADLYATAIVLYEMLTGRVPFEAETELATATLRLTTDPRPPGDLRAGIPREIDTIVMRALAREPDGRFASAGEMSAALHRVAASDTRPHPPVAHPGAPSSPEEPHSFFRSWMLVPVTLLALALLAVGAGLMLGRLEVGGPLGIRVPGGGDAGSGDLEKHRIAAVQDHDPGGDGVEHPGDLHLAIDGDPDDTFWQTERYNTPDLGGLKSGVGIILDLGTPRMIREVRLRTTIPGWTFELQGSDDATSFSNPLAREDGSRSFTAKSRSRVRLEGAEYRYLLVWITELPPADTGYRATISDVEVRG